MTTDEEKRISALSRKVIDRTILRLAVTADERSLAMETFCERLATLVPQISIIREESFDQDYPLLLLPNGVRYQGTPRGNEVEPFVDALAGRTAPLPQTLQARFEAVRLPAAIDLYVIPQCLHCPQTARGLIAMADVNRLLQLTIIDAELFPEAAERCHIQAVPTAVLDGQFRWTGAVKLEEVVDWMTTRDPASLGPSSLLMMLQEGSADRLAEMMIQSKALFPALLELLCHEKWSVRLGAMVTVEQLSVLNSDLAQEALKRLWGRFEASSDTVRGDILFLSGEVGGEWVIPKVKGVLSSADSEVKEAAVEALEKLRERKIGP
jgi:hypothetical protein